MRTDLFDFELPEDLIALRPLSPRDASRLLVVKPGEPPADRMFCDLPSLLRPGDCLVFNDTRVVPAALLGQRIRGDQVSEVHFNLHARVDERHWRAFARPAKRLADGDRIRFVKSAGETDATPLEATVKAKGEGGEVTLAFDQAGPDLDSAIALVGQMPLPPYIAARRAADDTDRVNYQTIYATREGAVAAPTAGLHFTQELLSALYDKGMCSQFVTLHVGAGTFLPVKVENTEDHRMHAEWGEVSSEVAAALNAVKSNGGRIVAVGTTALRLLESAADDHGIIQTVSGDTDIFITPGYRFKAVDILLTNFHLPKSTLFMLVCALAGTDTMTKAYAHAVAERYRFYSYGDASLLFRAE
ncbi:S-adenosylmethionine:tRNA ribosyltransferase-isomerase [Candidatus Filomicrobium marinum]|uniref:S-adenosylmethionine:tRNA ribosyltransferase-isomerase n=1 Tax=Candidatus Filomicrobium marinum TaxID=1608628 RepID=A0A0D6JHG6_9HYPH|nr:tRNA preQ1(34) S-adenosylmethionine ribosyltransferase-isomerase QueA [Candidatus Filomicrobium marinum]CFX43202.1 S-adenosylmethionine:tRNA ribosyltransferase-isomerase [Candidatus Filomicrobium marinum]CPR20996.1 S-adenosylmethionine:tRNA ribosyltransferase-isomerase [Candidatus Filomicrobium marinum]